MGTKGGDASRFASFDVLDLEAATISHRFDLLNTKRLHCRRCGWGQQAHVENLVAHRLLTDQLVLHVYGELHILVQ